MTKLLIPFLLSQPPAGIPDRFFSTMHRPDHFSRLGIYLYLYTRSYTDLFGYYIATS